MTAAGLIVGVLLALTLLARELAGIIGRPRGRASTVLRAAAWVGAAAFAALTAVRLVQFIA